jgi:hypothetical protein
MTNLKPLARNFYATAFLLPFLWAANGNPIPLFDDAPAPTATISHTPTPVTRFAALDKKLLFPLIQN